MPHDAKVLVVDDSAAMRALFCDILDEAKNVTVVGAAASADEARAAILQLKPNVLTLDVEMPGTSGLEFLEEIMSTSPMPVVMLSGLTQAGADASVRAFELGAVECFGKPLRSTPEQFAKTVSKLGKIVLAAANSNVRTPRKAEAKVGAEAAFAWNGHLLVFSASMGGIDALNEIAAHMPKDGPPALLVLQGEADLVLASIRSLDKSANCHVVEAVDGALLEPGTLHVAFRPERHAIVEAGSPARLRLIDKEPVNGSRPSADLLCASLGRAQVPVVAAVLTGLGVDGAKGLSILHSAGAKVLVEDPGTALVSETPRAAIAQCEAAQVLPLTELVAAAVGLCNQA